MKKTIIAASIAAVVAAPAAFADVSISGAALVELINDSASSDGLENDSAFDLNFSASEDLGNGMKATAVISLQSDFDDSTTVGRNDQYVAISGDFGTVIAGKLESLTEGKVSAMASVDSSENLAIEPGAGSDRAAADTLAVAYVSPTMNGFHFGVAGFADDTDAAPANDENFDSTDVMVEYANGPLLVRVGRTDYADVNAGVDGEEVLAIGVNYKMGDTTLIAVHQNRDNVAGTNNDDRDGWMVGAKTSMGSNSFGLGYMKEDATANGATENKYWIIDAAHNLSKTTKVYATYRDNDEAGTTSSDFAIGMAKNF